MTGNKKTSHADNAVALYGPMLTDAGAVTSKKMFGGYGLFENGVMFGMVTSAGVLCFKVDESNVAGYEALGGEKFRTMPYYSVPAEIIEDQDQLLAWAGDSIRLAHQKKKE